VPARWVEGSCLRSLRSSLASVTGPSSRPLRWLGSIRVRILAVGGILLVVSSIGSVFLLRAVLLQRLQDEVEESLRREVEEFQLLSTGTNPETGQPFDGDLRAVFDVYFSRELPDEGESLLAFIDGELYDSRRAPDAAEADELRPTIEHWLSLERYQQGAIDTDAGTASYVALPLQGRGKMACSSWPISRSSNERRSIAPCEPKSRCSWPPCWSSRYSVCCWQGASCGRSSRWPGRRQRSRIPS